MPLGVCLATFARWIVGDFDFALFERPRRGASLSPAPDLTYRPLSAHLAKRGLVFPMRLLLVNLFGAAPVNEFG